MEQENYFLLYYTSLIGFFDENEVFAMCASNEQLIKTLFVSQKASKTAMEGDKTSASSTLITR